MEAHLHNQHWPMLGQMWPKLVDMGQVLPEFGPNSADSGRTVAQIVQIGPNLVDLGRTLAKLGRSRTKPVRNCPNHVSSVLVDIGTTRSAFSECLPSLVGVGPLAASMHSDDPRSPRCGTLWSGCADLAEYNVFV